MSDPPFLDLPTQSVDGYPIRATSPDILDLRKVAAHIDEAVGRGRYHGPTTPLDYLLHKRCVVQVADQLYATLAGIICFGQNPQLFLPKAVVDIGQYSGTESVSSDVLHLEKEIGGTIFDQLARVETYVWANIHHGMTLSEHSFQRIEVHEYPRPVIRELCVNMLAHRDYINFLSNARIQMFRNRIEWISPGSLPPGITVDNLLSEQASRNPVILSILYEAGYVEAFGQGLDTVVSVLKQEGMLPPGFQDTGASFIVTVYTRLTDDAGGDSELMRRLSDAQRLLLNYIRLKEEVTPREVREMFDDRSERSLQRDLRVLIDARLVEQVGGSRSLSYRILPTDR